MYGKLRSQANLLKSLAKDRESKPMAECLTWEAHEIGDLATLKQLEGG